MLSVAEIMSPEPYTLGPDDTLQDAATLMAEHHIRHIPVVSSEGAIVGLVSHRDVLAVSDSRLLARRADGDEGNVSAYVALSAVMSSPVQSVDEHEELRAVGTLMHQHKLGCLPVTRKGKLVGIVSASDFLEVALALMEQLEMSEPEEEETEDDF
ncbi:MAG: CBS domain-containing protein [Halieaceae bacterium]|jgi:CBS domain-containing protein|nr:CBS domain-containing protein [Halieaceae bacterium]